MIRSDHDATQEEVHHQISKVMNHGSKEEWGSAALCSMREALIYAHLNLGFPRFEMAIIGNIKKCAVPYVEHFKH